MSDSLVQADDREQILKEVEEKLMPRLRREVNNRLDDALAKGGFTVDFPSVFNVFHDYIFGRSDADRRSVVWFLREYFFFFVVSLVAIIFGMLGLLPNLFGAEGNATAAGFLDIAKIFAGTAVGGAAGTAVARRGS